MNYYNFDYMSRRRYHPQYNIGLGLVTNFSLKFRITLSKNANKNLQLTLKGRREPKRLFADLGRVF
jgi:hypothetical protein